MLTAYSRIIDVMQVLIVVCQLSILLQRWPTHKIPTANTPMTANFCFLGRCKSFKTYKGSATTAISVTTLKEELKYQKTSNSIHLPGSSWIQKDCNGRHEEIEAVKTAMPYDETIETSTHAVIRVPGVVKNRRNWNNADSFTIVSATLYRGMKT